MKKYKFPSKSTIKEFVGEYEFLNNDFLVSIKINNVFFPSITHYYYASRCKNVPDYKKVLAISDCKLIKKIAEKYEIKPDWDKKRLNVMLNGLKAKFKFKRKKRKIIFSELAKKLLLTDNIYLINGNHNGDLFWGIDLRTDEGQNYLGRLLMRIREDLKKKKINEEKRVLNREYKEALGIAKKKVRQLYEINELIENDDYIPFDGKKCITHCIGRCCINTPVQINTYDIYAIVSSKQGHALGFENTMKLFEGPNAPFIYFLEKGSNIPICYIDFIQYHTNFSICPFAVESNKSLDKVNLIDQYFRRTFNSRSKDMPHLFCLIHNIKPTICRSSPISRIQVSLNYKDYSFYFFNPPSSKCPAIDTTKKWKLEDYINKWDLEKFYLNRGKIIQIIELLAYSTLDYRLKIAEKLFNFDKETIKNGLDPSRHRPSFDQLIKNIKEEILNFLEL